MIILENKPIILQESYGQRLLFLCDMILVTLWNETFLSTVMTNIVVVKSTDNAEPLSIC